MDQELGKPDLRLEGLELWIHGRQFPDSQDYWDGNWVRATARCHWPGASVRVSGSFLHLSELASWRAACQELSRSLSGEANLETKESDLGIKMKGDGLGHIFVDVSVTPDTMNQRHRFEFQIDQTVLPSLISQLDKVLEKVPIREVGHAPAPNPRLQRTPSAAPPSPLNRQPLGHGWLSVATVTAIAPLLVACTHIPLARPVDLNRVGESFVVQNVDLHSDTYYVGFGIRPPWVSGEHWLAGASWDRDEGEIWQVFDVDIHMVVRNSSGKAVLDYVGPLSRPLGWTISNSSPAGKWAGSIYYHPDFKSDSGVYSIALWVFRPTARAAAYSPTFFVASTPKWP